VHAPPELGFHLAQLGLQPRTNRLPEHSSAHDCCRFVANLAQKPNFTISAGPAIAIAMLSL
jgi:hypothetical protein